MCVCADCAGWTVHIACVCAECAEFVGWSCWDLVDGGVVSVLTPPSGVLEGSPNGVKFRLTTEILRSSLSGPR